MADRLSITVNGRNHKVSASGETPLLYVLRNELSLTGAQFGCGLGQCGACTVLLDRRAVRSCSLPVSKAAGRHVTTVEGIGTPEAPHPVQAAFVEHQAAQCGYCSAGMIMSAVELLNRNGNPGEAEIRKGMDGNLCRCGSHLRIIRAIERAAGMMRGDDSANGDDQGSVEATHG